MEQVLNLSLRESLLRGLAAILIPMLILLIDHRLIVYFLPVIVYLYITAMVHICPIKHTWRLKFLHIPDDNDNNFWDR
ncbi:MAG TPA: hypothetical protein VHE34_24810 [Puia sp.]|uniref:hypothetical protein n=1 Tax=Puia sp. TaxID=2045100 RepID=UPI002B8D64B7|nr:hypothetical protein [Puia sp.]HVU98478.1 hypothetical protein [Puia sp.]